MPDLICNTSPIQYLHQLDLLDILRNLSSRVIVPPAVVAELNAGRTLGLYLPDVTALLWANVHRPTSDLAVPLVTDLGPGETEVLMLALELRGTVVVLDDALGRRMAEALGIPLTGTLGLLLNAKRVGLISSVAPYLDKLGALRFRLASHTRAAVLNLAGEA